MHLKEIANRFEGVQWRGKRDSFQAKCPVHYDKVPNPTKFLSYMQLLKGSSITQLAEFTETMMGFPKGWTDLDALETP